MASPNLAKENKSSHSQNKRATAAGKSMDTNVVRHTHGRLPLYLAGQTTEIITRNNASCGAVASDPFIDGKLGVIGRFLAAGRCRYC